MGTCCVEGCAKPTTAKDMCSTHYMRMRRTGSPMGVRRLVGATDEERFWQYVRKTPTCWLWKGGLSHGYGSFHVRDSDGRHRQVLAHRFAWTLLIGPIPDDLTLDHIKDRCGNKNCVKVIANEHGPAHLEPVTLRVNIQRGGNGQKTHCKRGHEFTPENIYVMRNDGRSCRACMKVHDANRRARHRSPDTPPNPVALNREKTHCKRGHPFDEANTYHKPDGNRACRTCNREKMQRRRAGARSGTSA